jgi:predicted RNase H-like HicB family nuclease
MSTAYMLIMESARDEQGTYYAGYFPDLPGCTTMGSTLKDLRRNAKEAVSLTSERWKRPGNPSLRPARACCASL